MTYCCTRHFWCNRGSEMKKENRKEENRKEENRKEENRKEEGRKVESGKEEKVRKEKRKTCILGKQITIKRRLLVLVMTCWIVPVFIIFLFLSISYRNSIIQKTEILMEEWAKNFTMLHAQRLNEAIDMSKKSSYEKVFETNWKKYREDLISESEFYKEVVANLKSQYYNDNRFTMAVFYLSEDTDKIYYTAGNCIRKFETEIKDIALEITREDTSDAHIRIINDKIYIIRNLYTTTNYTKFGTLVLEINETKLLDNSLNNKAYELGFYINNTEDMIVYDKTLEEEAEANIVEKLRQNYSVNNNYTLNQEQDIIYTGIIYQQKFNDYHLGTILVANKNVIYSEIKDMEKIVALILMVIIPVFIYMIYFISKHITTPIEKMIDASKELEKGNIGMQMEEDSMPNVEFTYLLKSFNRMSSEIKFIFTYANNEEIAKKEAKIIALQSQINPHFLYNTLEMMNWKARMAGDIEVSKMIEALGTLLDYTMDRSNKKLINLAEELRCADAYFYITSMRFGKRLQVEKEIDSSLLETKVPQLVLQPILENAVVHGIEVVNRGTIKLKIYRNEDNIILQVINTGKTMSQEDLARVNDILSGKILKNPSEDGVHISLGIRNVNERIKLIYGEKYGLTILPMNEEEIVSTIILPLELQDNPEKDKLLHVLLG